MINNFSKEFFVKNRSKLVELLPDSLIVLTANSRLQSSADLSFKFRQDSNFWYFTGIDQPDIYLAINTTSNKSTLLVEEQNSYQKEWDGEIKIDKLLKQSGVEEVRLKSELISILKNAKLSGLQICNLAPPPTRVEPYGFYSNPARKNLEDEINKIEEKPKDIRLELARIRQIKEPEEIEAISEAIKITGNGLSEIKTRLKDYKNESEIERDLTANFYAGGALGHAYDPIVAGGKNASIIHYVDNNDDLPKNGLLLLDVGANYCGYAADISRTWALGEPSKKQKEVYKHVVELQNYAFSLLKPGVKLREYQKQMELQAQKVMKKLKLDAGKYPHGFSHFLGLDVHDAGDYEQPLQENSVITVEPGIYIPKEGVGVRIEDDVLITKNGIKNLSEEIPREL